MQIVDRRVNEDGGGGVRAEINVTMTSVTRVHRSLFHPLAALRHRI
jgi:hypothetical protein